MGEPGTHTHVQPMTNTTALTTADIVDAILAGVADDNLDAISGAIQDRKQHRARVAFHTVKPGTKARLKNLRPKYMVGAPCEVVSKKQTRIVIKVDESWLASNPQASRYCGQVTVTPDMLDFEV